AEKLAAPQTDPTPAEWVNYRSKLEQLSVELLNYRSKLEQLSVELQHLPQQIQPHISVSRDSERLLIEINELKQRMSHPDVAQSSGGNGRPVIAAEKEASFPMSESFRYYAFEEIFRGSSSWLKDKIKDYGPLFQGAPEPILDIGCGRGEFLEL